MSRPGSPDSLEDHDRDGVIKVTNPALSRLVIDQSPLPVYISPRAKPAIRCKLSYHFIPELEEELSQLIYPVSFQN